MKLQVETSDTPLKRHHSQPTTFMKQISEGSFYRIFESEDGNAIRIAKKPSHSSVETEILSTISHPLINKMIRYWAVDGFMHYEMEMCRQCTLSDKIDRMKPSCLRKHLRNSILSNNLEEDPSPVPSIQRPSIRANVLDDPFAEKSPELDGKIDPNSSSFINTSSLFTDDEESGDSIENSVLTDMKLRDG